MRGWGTGLGVAAAVGVAAVVYLELRRPASPPPPYADSAKCAICHPAITATFRRNGMGRSFARAGDNTIPPFPAAAFYHRASESYYRVLKHDGAYFVRRYQPGSDGSEENAEEKQIHYVMGSGNHSRSLLHRTPEGRLLELPLAWYAEGGGSWAMSPGYDRPHHDDFRRRVTHECIFCHNAYPVVPARADASGMPPVFPADLPSGIDCQRCHGPGADHVRAAESGARRERVRAAIVHPARLSRDRQIEICMQCHLETTSFPLPYSIRRFERGIFSFHPGEPLAQSMFHFDHAAGSSHEDKFEIVNAV